MTIQPLSESDSTIVTLLPIFIAKNGRAVELERLLLTLQIASRADRGCLRYSVFHDLDDENRFIMHEEWASLDLLADHNEQAHVREFVAQVDKHLREPFTVTWMRPIAE